MSDDDKKPIPREEPAPESDSARTLRLLETMNAKLDTTMRTQGTHGTILGGLTDGVIELRKRVEVLETKAPGSNPPPRTASGFTAAVRQISTTTESAADRATALQVQELKNKLESIEAKTDLQTEMLGKLVTAAGSFVQNPTVRKIAYVAGGLLLGWLTHLAQKGLYP